MGKIAQLVMGPAGSGKSTYCSIVHEYCVAAKRRASCLNLDPAAESFHYPVSIDVRELVKVEDVAKEEELGPNGALVFAMEVVAENLDWLEDQIGDYDDDYLLIDCPGQIELYSHLPIMPKIVRQLQDWGYTICGVYLMDALFMTDASKFMAGSLSALSAMIRLELPHVNVLSKCDLVKDRLDELEPFFSMDTEFLVDKLHQDTSSRFHALNESLADLLENYGMVGFLPLDARDQESVATLMQHIDRATQFGEDEEVRDRFPEALDGTQE